MTNDSLNQNRVPGWAANPFEAFLDLVQEIGQITELSLRGISMIRAAPRISTAVAKATGEDEGERGDYFEKLAEAAQREVDKGFPLLLAQATISLWSSLEFLIKDFLLTWLANDPTAIEAQAVQKTKIPLSQYEKMSSQERYHYIVDTLERDVQAPLKQGVSRFEELLKVFDLNGPVSDNVRRTLFELSNVRNVLVHRRGVADRRLTEACPWLNLSIGDSVVVTYSMFKDYSRTVVDYALAVFKRVSARFGVELYQDENGEWQTTGG